MFTWKPEGMLVAFSYQSFIELRDHLFVKTSYPASSRDPPVSASPSLGLQTPHYQA